MEAVDIQDRLRSEETWYIVEYVHIYINIMYFRVDSSHQIGKAVLFGKGKS